MNGQKATATRRELRKAFGGAALDTLDAQADGIRGVAAQVGHLAEQTYRDQKRQDENCQERWDSCSQTHKRLFDRADRADEFRTMGFWRRWYWLLTGR